MWNRNCVALGLAAGFLEPLESTSIHLVQSAAIRLVRLFPDGETDQATIDEFNRQCDFEWERVRDFIVLHYWANQRDGDFWTYCRNMELPETLTNKIDVWRSNGRIFREDDELFGEESWIQVFLGQGIVPRGYDPLVAIKSDAQIEQFLGNIATTIDRCISVMPSHDEYVTQILSSCEGRMKRLATLLSALALAGCVTVPPSAPRAAEMWVTTADETHKLAPQPALAPVGPATGDEAVAIDPARHFQRMHGFGAAITDASAELLSRLPEDKRRAIMAELFGRDGDGLGLSFTRLTVGASDFSREPLQL